MGNLTSKVHVENYSLSLKPAETSPLERAYFYDLQPNSSGEVRQWFETKLEKKRQRNDEVMDDKELTQKFVGEITGLLVAHVHQSNDRTQPVLIFHHPRLLLKLLNKVLFLQTDPKTLDQVVSGCSKILRFCVKTGHPRFFNQISQGLDILGLAGEWMTATTNISLSSENAVLFQKMEEVVIGKLVEAIGWSGGEGVLTPGGTMSNLYSVAVARNSACSNIRIVGFDKKAPMILFTSDQSHFSIKRAGILLGVGGQNVVMVASDDRGKMQVSDLKEKIKAALAAGGHPFAVCATSGSTVLGAFDDLWALADVCEEFSLWFHVDAAWGGGLLFSKTHHQLLHGIHRADSVTWNPHKLLGVPLQCSAFLVNKRRVSKEAGWKEDLMVADKNGLKASRHNDALKLWLLMKGKGTRLMGTQIDTLMKLALYMQEQIHLRPGFEFVLQDPPFLNICFWYVPRKLRNLEAGEERDLKLSMVAPKVKAVMMEKGGSMVGYQPLGDKPNFFRMIISNPASKQQDIDHLLDQIQLYGEL